EGARPVYVPADSIVATTGALTSLDSRVHPQFGQVIAIRSDLQSDTRQLTVGLSRLPPRGAALQVSYTFTRARDQSSFSCCAASQGFAAPTTAGDPNEREWATSALERRHSLLAIVSFPVNAALGVSALGRLTSGAPFTPLGALRCPCSRSTCSAGSTCGCTGRPTCTAGVSPRRPIPSCCTSAASIWSPSGSATA